VTEPLTASYLEEARRRANRFMGQWCGTSGSLAADVRRLLWEVDRLKAELAVERAARQERQPYWMQPHD
jgi:hypothetical protein